LSPESWNAHPTTRIAHHDAHSDIARVLLTKVKIA
jgi:hypothetical protein